MNVTDQPPEVLLYTRPGCHLCEEVKQQIHSLQETVGFSFQEVDIDGDPGLHQLYNEQVPVVFIHGKKAFKFGMDPAQFLRRLQEGQE